MGPDLREQHERLGLLHRRLPAACNQILDHAWGEFSALGYSGSNSGGSLVVENSQFDNNQDGFDTNSQNGDNPRRKMVRARTVATSPITHTHSCWVFMDNDVHDNNNPNVPSRRRGRGGPGRHGHDGLRRSRRHGHGQPFVNNDAWGLASSPIRTAARRARAEP